jgi:hypothetical protein
MPSIIKLGTSLIKVHRSDTCYKCHTVGHIAKFCPLNEAKKNPTQMTERMKERQPVGEWLHRRDGTSVEVNKQSEGEEEERENGVY